MGILYQLEKNTLKYSMKQNKIYVDRCRVLNGMIYQYIYILICGELRDWLKGKHCVDLQLYKKGSCKLFLRAMKGGLAMFVWHGIAQIKKSYWRSNIMLHVHSSYHHTFTIYTQYIDTHMILSRLTLAHASWLIGADLPRINSSCQRRGTTALSLMLQLF